MVVAPVMRSIRKMFLAFVVLALFAVSAANADFSGAVAAYNRGDFKAAAAEFQKLAAAGDPAAMNNLGLMFGRGQGVKQDHRTARQWYEKAAKLGNPDAMNNLGVMYELGQGVAKDYRQAFQWYQRAAKLGISDAQYNLAALYASGQGVGKDVVQAYTLFALAAAKGDRDAGMQRDFLQQQMTPDQLVLAKQKLQALSGQ